MVKTKTLDYNYYLRICIMLLLIFGSNFVPAIGPLTDYGTTIAGIFLGIIYGYLNFGMTIPSFLALIAIGFSGYDTVPGVLKSALGNGIVLYVFSILIFSQILQDSGLANKMINWIISRKIAKGKPWILSFLFMMTAYLVSLLVNFIPPCIILWGMLKELFKTVGFKPGDKWPMIILAGVLYMSTMGGFVAPYQTGVVGNFGILTAVSNGALTFNAMRYFLWAFVIGLILMLLWLLFARFVINPDVSLLKREDLFEEDTTPLTVSQKIVVVLFVLFIAGLVLPSILPENLLLTKLLLKIDNCGWGVLMVAIACLIRMDGKNLFDFGEMFSKGVIWDLPIMMACVFTIAGILTDQSTGIPIMITQMIQPLMDAMSMTSFWLVLVFIVLLLSNITNTLVITCTFIPMLYTVAADTGMNLVLFTACVNFIGNMCFLSPACCMNAAMLYGEKTWLNTKFCMLFATFVFVTLYIVIVGIGLPLGNILL